MKKLLIFLAVGVSFLHTACSTDSVSDTNTANPVDVYIAGSKDGHACYWKNNQLVLLDSGAFTDLSAKKIVVSNDDVYVLGYGFAGSSTSSPLVWKNGILTNLGMTLRTDEYFPSIVDMQVIGNDVYYAGYTYAIPFDTSNPSKLAYWKNNVINVVDEFPTFVFSEARIKVVNNDICIIASNDQSIVIKGYYLNGAYHQIPGVWSYNLTSSNDQIYAFGSQQPNGFYYNISSGVQTSVTTSNTTGINQMGFDNGNLYYSDGEKIYKNGTIVYSENFLTNNILDFNPLNDNLFVISGGNDVNNANEELRINGVTTLTAAEGENFVTLFLVQN
jgi:hypothetical protein